MELILKLLKIDAGMWNCVKAYWSGFYLAAITPGKVVDLSRVYFLDKENLSVGKTTLADGISSRWLLLLTYRFLSLWGQ